MHNGRNGKNTGIVKWFNATKGYGFLKPDGGGADIFVHFTGILGEGYRELNPDDKVEFDTEESDKGTKAINVEVV